MYIWTLICKGFMSLYQRIVILGSLVCAPMASGWFNWWLAGGHYGLIRPLRGHCCIFILLQPMRSFIDHWLISMSHSLMLRFNCVVHCVVFQGGVIGAAQKWIRVWCWRVGEQQDSVLIIITKKDRVQASILGELTTLNKSHVRYFQSTSHA